MVVSRYKEPAGHSRLAGALIEDRSDNGMSVRVKQEISIDATLEIYRITMRLRGLYRRSLATPIR